MYKVLFGILFRSLNGVPNIRTEVGKLKFLKPKNKKAEPVDWQISERTRSIVKYYAEYSERTESEVVDEFLENILEDKKFIEWIDNRRNNKRIKSQIKLEEKAV